MPTLSSNVNSHATGKFNRRAFMVFRAFVELVFSILASPMTRKSHFGKYGERRSVLVTVTCNPVYREVPPKSAKLKLDWAKGADEDYATRFDSGRSSLRIRRGTNASIQSQRVGTTTGLSVCGYRSRHGAAVANDVRSQGVAPSRWIGGCPAANLGRIEETQKRP
jgi:hypothetical protein